MLRDAESPYFFRIDDILSLKFQAEQYLLSSSNVLNCSDDLITNLVDFSSSIVKSIEDKSLTQYDDNLSDLLLDYSRKLCSLSNGSFSEFGCLNTDFTEASLISAVYLYDYIADSSAVNILSFSHKVLDRCHSKHRRLLQISETKHSNHYSHVEPLDCEPLWHLSSHLTYKTNFQAQPFSITGSCGMNMHYLDPSNSLFLDADEMSKVFIELLSQLIVLSSSGNMRLYEYNLCEVGEAENTDISSKIGVCEVSKRALLDFSVMKKEEFQDKVSNDRDQFSSNGFRKTVPLSHNLIMYDDRPEDNEGNLKFEGSTYLDSLHYAKNEIQLDLKSLLTLATKVCKEVCKASAIVRNNKKGNDKNKKVFQCVYDQYSTLQHAEFVGVEKNGCYPEALDWVSVVGSFGLIDVSGSFNDLNKFFSAFSSSQQQKKEDETSIDKLLKSHSYLEKEENQKDYDENDINSILLRAKTKKTLKEHEHFSFFNFYNNDDNKESILRNNQETKEINLDAYVKEVQSSAPKKESIINFNDYDKKISIQINASWANNINEYRREHIHTYINRLTSMDSIFDLESAKEMKKGHELARTFFTLANNIAIYREKLNDDDLKRVMHPLVKSSVFQALQLILANDETIGKTTRTFIPLWW